MKRAILLFALLMGSMFPLLIGDAVPARAGSFTWTPSGLDTEVVYSVAVSPNYANDRTLFAGGDGKVWRSTDGGNSWNAGVPVTGTVVALDTSPNFAADHTLFAAGLGSGLYRSTNSGDSWTQVHGDTGTRTLAISPDFASDSTVFIGAALTSPSGVYRSTNGGDSWTRVVTGMSNVYVFSLAISPNYASDHTLFAGTNGYIFQSTNSADTWERVLGGFGCLLGAIKPMAISPDYATDGVAFAGYGNKVLRRSGSWSCSSVQVATNPIQAFAVSPDYADDQTLFAGTGGSGVSESITGGSTWTAMNAGLGNLNVYGLAITPTSVQTLLAATGQGVWKYTLGALPNLQVTPPTLVFLAEYNGADPVARPVQIGGTPGLGWTATITPSVGWLAVNPAAGTIPTTTNVSVSASGLVTGTYTTTVVFDAGADVENSPRLVPVQLVVSEMHRIYLPAVTK
jgi:photosystem II stability/assembly factor-like uncharacterized protein